LWIATPDRLQKCMRERKENIKKKVKAWEECYSNATKKIDEKVNNVKDKLNKQNENDVLEDCTGISIENFINCNEGEYDTKTGWKNQVKCLQAAKEEFKIC